jgi:hypothetical protein
MAGTRCHGQLRWGRRRRLRGLLAFEGKVHWEGDLGQLRKRESQGLENGEVAEAVADPGEAGVAGAGPDAAAKGCAGSGPARRLPRVPPGTREGR